MSAFIAILRCQDIAINQQLAGDSWPRGVNACLHAAKDRYFRYTSPASDFWLRWKSGGKLVFVILLTGQAHSESRLRSSILRMGLWPICFYSLSLDKQRLVLERFLFATLLSPDTD
jgi:hypothetical protein